MSFSVSQMLLRTWNLDKYINIGYWSMQRAQFHSSDGVVAMVAVRLTMLGNWGIQLSILALSFFYRRIKYLTRNVQNGAMFVAAFWTLAVMMKPLN